MNNKKFDKKLLEILVCPLCKGDLHYDELNQELEKALRVADFMELGQLMAQDALQRNESCGGHFREEYQDAEGETLRDDVNFKFVGAWEYKGEDISKEELHKEELNYEVIKIAARNYK